MSDDVEIYIFPQLGGLRVRVVRGNPDREFLLKSLPRGWTLTEWSFANPQRMDDGTWYDAIRIGQKHAAREKQE